MNFRIWTRPLVIVHLAIGLVGAGICQKPGDLVVTPTRLTLSTKNKTGDLTLLNRGSQPIRYRLRFIDMEMTQDGVLQKALQKPENSAEGFYRLSPREVLLQPGEFQRIKVLATFPPGTKECEYRSHLAFEPILMPRANLASSQELSGISLNFELRSVVTIPVIARCGQVTGSSTLAGGEIVADQDGWKAIFTIFRSGNRTVRGDAVVSFLSESGGKPIVIGEISGLPIYYPNPSRTVALRLRKNPTKLGKGKIEVKFDDFEAPKGSPSLRRIISILN